MKALKKYLDQAEKTLAGWLKNAPNMSDSARESLAKAWPWIALVFGVLQILTALGLTEALRRSERVLTEYSNIYSEFTNGASIGLSTADRAVIYLGVAVLLVDGVILLMAYNPLKKRERRGWDLLFLAALINVGYGVVSVFIDSRGIGSLLWSLIGSGIGFYLLFQVQNKFAKK